MPFLNAPEKPDRIEFKDWRPPQRVVLNRFGFLIPLDCDENRALGRVVQSHLTYEYPDNPHAGRYAKKPDPLLAYRRDIDEQTQKEFLLVPKHFGIRQFGGREGFTYTNEQTGGLAMDESLMFSEKRKLVETQRAPQQSATTFALNNLRRTGGACLCMPVGCGKTVCGIWIAMQLRVKTLIVAAKGDLLDQWTERIIEYVPSAAGKIGRIQADICNTKGCDFVLATAQSLSQKVYNPEMLREFGLVIFDEAHHAAAPSFLCAVWQVAAPYMLALTADPTRTDGMTEVLYQFFSWNVFVIPPVLPADIFLNIRVHRLANRCYFEDADLVDAKDRRLRNIKYPLLEDAETRADKPVTPLDPVDIYSNKRAPYTGVYKGVAKQANRNAIIAAYIKHFLAHNDVNIVHPPSVEEIASAELADAVPDKERGEVRVMVDGEYRLISSCSIDECKRLKQVERQIMILSVHKEHILSLRARLIRSGVPKHMISIYWGEMKAEARKKALFARVIIATYGMAAEGLDLPTLNSMILATPRSKTADQATGRMLRDKLNASIQPCLIDMVDEWCQMAELMYWKRHETFTSYKPQARIEFYDDERTDSILGQYCKKRDVEEAKKGKKRKGAEVASKKSKKAKVVIEEEMEDFIVQDIDDEDQQGEEGEEEDE